MIDRGPRLVALEPSFRLIARWSRAYLVPAVLVAGFMVGSGRPLIRHHDHASLDKDLFCHALKPAHDADAVSARGRRRFLSHVRLAPDVLWVD